MDGVEHTSEETLRFGVLCSVYMKIGCSVSLELFHINVSLRRRHVTECAGAVDTPENIVQSGPFVK